jgi:hypothetical protein
LPTVLQQYKSTDEKIIILLLLLWVYKGTTIELHCNSGLETERNQSTSFKNVANFN